MKSKTQKTFKPAREEKEKHNHWSSCCISHEFFKTASSNPNKIAIIHSSGAASIFRQHHPTTTTAATYDAAEHQEPSPFPTLPASSTSTSPSPTSNMYQGDQCYTFSQLLAAVDSLSCRLRCVLDGGSDPDLISSTRVIRRKLLPSTHVMNSSTTLKSIEQSPEENDMNPYQIVGIYMVPSVEYIVAILSTLRCGEVFMPLDPFWPKERILSIISSSNVDLIIGSSSSFGKKNHLPLDESHWLLYRSNCPVLCISMEDNHIKDIGSWPCQKEKQRPFCYLMYTSGSTGEPKGVCGTEHGLLNRFFWMQELYPLLGEEYLLFKTSISFIDHLQEFIASILTASTLVIPPFDELKDNLFYVLDFLQAYSITRLIAVPTLMRVILPSLQSQDYARVCSSLKLLVLSGEVLPLRLWEKLSELLPETSILNLYGSTEVSGDCMYFDCNRLTRILETETLSSVPIGIPISNCDVVLVDETHVSSQGEIYVGGDCVSSGYLSDPGISSLDYVTLPDGYNFKAFIDQKSRIFYRTGDFAKQLQSGDMVFIGRKDRTIKLGGQRIALEEIENTLSMHPDVADAAVISHKIQEDAARLEAFLVLRGKDAPVESSGSSIRNWLVEQLPLAMIPNRFSFVESFPVTSTGKADYSYLASSSSWQEEIETSDSQYDALFQDLKKAFCDALDVSEVSSDDDFFAMGGNSLVAAQVSHVLGIDMRLLYINPSLSKLHMALLRKEDAYCINAQVDANIENKYNLGHGNVLSLVESETPDLYSLKTEGKMLRTLHAETDESSISSDYLKADSKSCTASGPVVNSVEENSWGSVPVTVSCSYSRGNKVLQGDFVVNNAPLVAWSELVQKHGKGSMQQVWKVHMESCVDASPVVLFTDGEIYLFIGSHSRKFVCINAKSGFVLWEVKLDGRIECSAAILGDFLQVVVGCYKGKVYFLDTTNGNICWSFQTCGEVKSQPVVDTCRHLVWCGSYDHNLYALDYKQKCCIYKLPCGGSIFGSPTLEEAHEKLYVASTNGRVVAISLKEFPFTTMWKHEFGAPVFGSLVITPNENVICCLVDGNVVALSSSGAIAWRSKVGGPIFAGACISYVLPSQALICSRNGSIYSFELEMGHLVWEYDIGDPITSSAYVDENFQLVSESSYLPDRLVSVCSSSGSIYLLQINSYTCNEANKPKCKVEEYAKLDLQGDIFSSPVMIGGRVFVGCRDDYVHCIAIGSQISMPK